MAKKTGRMGGGSSKVNKNLSLDGKRYLIGLTRLAADIVERKGDRQQQPFIIDSVLRMSAHVGGPDDFHQAIRHLSDSSHLNSLSGVVEAAVWVAEGINLPR